MGALLDIEFGQFSDTVVISGPETKPLEVLTFAAAMRRGLLFRGFLSRGGVSFGDLYHEENVVAGPALIAAYKMEREAIFPRLLNDQDAIKKIMDVKPNIFLDGGIILTDMLGTLVVNLYISASETREEWESDNERAQREYAEIQKLDDRIREGLAAVGSDRHKREKWEYLATMRPIMEGRAYLKFVGELTEEDEEFLREPNAEDEAND